ncbi:conserved hypothetical protein, partial [Trichinella spiralis]|uniref:hypothetical protein n=1 Tax=Trichinella spiralis TaxID=6334 RepID=UPI0001EFCE00
KKYLTNLLLTTNIGNHFTLSKYPKPLQTETAHTRNHIYLLPSLVLRCAVRDLVRVVRIFTFDLLY